MEQLQITQQESQIVAQKSISELMQNFISFIDAKPTTLQAYNKNLTMFYKWLNENNISEPTRKDILNFKEYLQETGHKATTIQAYINTIKQFFKWLSYEGIYKNIAENIKGAKLTKGFKKDYLRIDQIKKVLSQYQERTTQKAKRDYAIIILCLCCGLRTIELERANIKDLANSGNSQILFIQGKGKDEKSDFVKLPYEVMEALADYIQTRPDKNNTEAPLFVSCSNNSVGHRADKGSISRVIKTAFRNVGLDSDRLTAHSLRHTTATLNLLNGGTLEETQQLLRHASINTTMIYNHALEREKNESEKRIANAIFNN